MPQPRFPAIAASLAAVLAGCSTVIDGTNQTIRFNADPMGARCVLTRDGKIIAELSAPGRVTVDKDKRDIQAVCMSEGYEDKLVTLRSGLAPATFANIVGTLGGGLDGGFADRRRQFLSRGGERGSAQAEAPCPIPPPDRGKVTCAACCHSPCR